MNSNLNSNVFVGTQPDIYKEICTKENNENILLIDETKYMKDAKENKSQACVF